MVRINKKGQVKIQQMAFMLIGLTIFFVLVAIFVMTFVLSGLKTSKADLNEQQATLLVQRLANSPEFACGNAFGTGKSLCVDMDKAMALKNYAEDYRDFWGVDGIQILRLYPHGNFTVECTGNTYPNCGHLTILSSSTLGTDDSSYVTLCRKDNINGTIINKCDMGEMVVRVTNGN